MQLSVYALVAAGAHYPMAHNFLHHRSLHVSMHSAIMEFLYLCYSIIKEPASDLKQNFCKQYTVEFNPNCNHVNGQWLLKSVRSSKPK